jgi:hypothetical protein
MTRVLKPKTQYEMQFYPEVPLANGYELRSPGFDDVDDKKETWYEKRENSEGACTTADWFLTKS